MKDRSSKSVVVALSGGIDSALAAALLKEEGWEVLGLHFFLSSPPGRGNEKESLVRRTARKLDIPVDFLDLRDVFLHGVIRPFAEAYLRGLTPNPCVLCNRAIKLEHLLARADAGGIGHVATGHYAKILRSGDGFPELRRGRDEQKEQSYFLHRLNRSQLSRTLFPLGEITKKEARRIALEMSLHVAREPDSQEICFVPGNDYRSFLESLEGGPPVGGGEILDMEGRKVGEHRGFYRYTIGQRHGLGIASSRPYYVREIRVEGNQVVVGRKEDLFSRTLEAEGFNWLEERPCEDRTGVLGQIRYRHRAAPGRLRVLSPDKVLFEFEEPQWAVTPGQALVCYEGDRVIGGGWITRAGS